MLCMPLSLHPSLSNTPYFRNTPYFPIFFSCEGRTEVLPSLTIRP